MQQVGEIDWTRVAAPQDDGYDTDVITRMLGTGRYAHAAPEVVGERIWPDGDARWLPSVERTLMPSREYSILPGDDEIIAAGLALLELWPAVRRQCAMILRGLCPLTSESRAHVRGMGRGCSCGHFGDNFGWIYVTADDAWGFAEGIVHEMGHWKLRALGIWFEDWTPLLLDHTPDEMYASPVRKDKPRPMGAVLHAQYSYIHVARMSTLALAATTQPCAQDIDWAALQLRRITEGRETLRTHARGTPGVGVRFLAALDAWTTQVIEDGEAIVAAAQERAV